MGTARDSRRQRDLGTAGHGGGTRGQRRVDGTVGDNEDSRRQRGTVRDRGPQARHTCCVLCAGKGVSPGDHVTRHLLETQAEKGRQ